MKRLASIGALVCCAFAPAALAGESDLYLSVPATGQIVRVDAATNTATPFATGVLIPHYGIFLEDGSLMMPDRGWPAVLKIDPNGTVHSFSAGGLFQKPVTIIPHKDGNGYLVTDMEAQRIVRLGFDGSQTLFADNTTMNGLLDWPDGMAFDDAGNLYIANLTGNNILKLDPQGNASVLSASTLIKQPGGLVYDGAGNLFAANYLSSTIVRIPLDDPSQIEVFAFDINVMQKPNDLKLSRAGGMVSSCGNASVVRVDALGNVSLIINDTSYGEVVGVSVPEDWSPCTGRYSLYGSGDVGSGGFTPKLRAIFPPCVGQAAALEFKDFLGGSPAVLLIGVAPGSQWFMGGTLLINVALPFTVTSFVMPGSGPGNGDFRLPFITPDSPAYVGAEFYHQVLQADPAGARGITHSNGLKAKLGT